MFEIRHVDTHSHARTGILHTDHGDIETPVFMPVGTQATVKTLDFADLNTIGAQIILGNTYHLHLRPGENLIQDFGGLHKFMSWDKPILTDSGGFQVFSLQHKITKSTNRLSIGAKKQHIDETIIQPDSSVNNQSKLVKIDDDGVTFTSHIDGSTHRFTPESAIEIQHKIGADIIMAFDECTPDDIQEQYVREAMERTHNWAKRSLDEHNRLETTAHRLHDHKQYLFGIIQGSNYKHLREESAKTISCMDFDGIAIGGESIGYNMEATKQILEWVMPLIPEHKPHYTMGVGYSPLDLFEVVERGIDMFDCVAPTRVARNGRMFVHPTMDKKLHINILNAQYREDKNPIDSTCTCFTCKNHSRAYIHHLFKAQELLAYRLSTIHNVHFFINLMNKMRQAIQEDKFLEMKNEWMNNNK